MSAYCQLIQYPVYPEGLKSTMVGKVFSLHTGVMVYETCYCLFIGSELRNWLLFFSLPVLREILPSQFFDHLALLVAAIYIFSSDCISEQDFLLGRHCLQQFYEKFSTLYGIKAPCGLHPYICSIYTSFISYFWCKAEAQKCLYCL